jgi:hypothetical protein
VKSKDDERDPTFCGVNIEEARISLIEGGICLYGTMKVYAITTFDFNEIDSLINETLQALFLAVI